ncbi:unnamed protein product [Acanthoscelides obtectus]|uniref:HTH psq-type domain-containing protein n=1 Tax=Acanthoscelides obtectus TaxID=200917 RepID=A0A9P0MKH4_ACAOB|nr:unnamed protein product [Acanthoscelides obtectus]CAK1630545.1 hypothetical protein AOBTE_LOCUS6398 [Acanthoscelides obtectus]
MNYLILETTVIPICGFLNMVRTYKKKTARGIIPIEQYESAMQAILQEKLSIRDAATRYGVNFMTLHRYMKRKLALNVENRSKCLVGYATHRKIFNDAEEQELAKYTEYSAKIYYGLTTSDLRKLAFHFAIANNISVPENWKVKEIASKDWLYGFLKGHQTLSVRTPEATSMGRATAFNPHNVSQFFNNLGKVYDKHKFQLQDVYNMDETGLTTVQRPTKIIAKRGTKQVGAITSGERGQLVTLALAVNANGNFVPPFIIFPRKKFKDVMVANGPPGCVDTPIKSALEEEERTRQRKKNVGATKRNISGELTSGAKSKCKKQSAKKTLKKIDSTSSEEDEESACLICLTPFSHSRNEERIQCFVCKGWAHNLSQSRPLELDLCS